MSVDLKDEREAKRKEEIRKESSFVNPRDKKTSRAEPLEGMKLAEKKSS